MRYEDLVTNPKEELTGIMKFVLDLDDLAGTNAERRIEAVTAMGAEAAKSYNLKPTTGKFNKNADKFTAEQIEFIKETNSHLLYYFGYTNNQTKENPYAFFNFEEHDAEKLKMFEKFREVNESQLLELVKNGGYKGEPYQINSDGVFDLIPKANLVKV